MIGMRYVQGLLLNRGPGTFTRSFQLNLELTNTICQLTLADLGDYNPQSRGLAELGFNLGSGEFVAIDIPRRARSA
jgi:hypothetical protein